MTRRVLLSLLALLAIAALPVLALYTEGGARLLLPAAARLAGIELHYAGGTLAGTLRLDALRLHREGLRLDLADLTLSQDPRCLWRSEICLEELGIGSLVLSLGDGAAGEEGATTGGDPVRFPVPVTVRSLRLGSASIEWPGGDWSQGGARLALRLAGADVTLADARIRDARLHIAGGPEEEPGERHITLPAIDLPLHLSVEGLTLDDPVLSLAGQDHALQRLSLAGDWSGNRLRLARLHADSEVLGSLALSDAEVQFRDDWPLRAEAGLAAPADPPWPHIGGRTARISLRGDLASLDIELDVPGEPALHGKGTADLLGAEPAVDARVVLDAGEPVPLARYVELPDALQDIELLAPITVTARGPAMQPALTVSGALRSPKTGTVALRGGARLEGERLDLEHLLLRRDDTEDELRLAGELDWREGIAWRLTAESPGLSLPAAAAPLSGRLAGSVGSTGALREGALRLSFDDVVLTGEINGAPARIEGAFALDDGELAPDSELRARLRGADLTLRPAADTPGETDLSLHVRELGDWHPSLAGEVRVQGRIDSDGRSSLRGDIAQLRWDDLHAASGNFSGTWDARDGAFDLRLSLEKTATPVGQFDSILLAADGDRDRLRARLASAGAIAGELAVTARRAPAGWRGELAPTALDIGGLTWRLEGPATLSLAEDGTASIAAHCWQQAQARLCAEDWTVGTRGGGSATLTADARLFERWLPADTALQGPIRADVAAGWGAQDGVWVRVGTAAGPLELTLTLPEGEQRQSRWRRLLLDARLRDGALSLEASLARGAQPEIFLALKLPARREGPLSGSLRIEELDLDGLTGLSTALGGLAGRVNGALALAGTVSDPLLYGELRLEDGRLLLSGYPTELERLELRLEARGDHAELTGRGLLGGGELAVSGDLRSEPQPRLTLSLRGRDNTILFPPSAELRTSSVLEIGVDAGSLSLTGEVTVHDGVFEYMQLPDHGVALSGDVVVVDSAGRVLEDEPPIALSMDVRVHVREDFVLRGPQLEAGLSGDLQLRRRPGQPLQIFGSLNTAGGHATAFERTLQIKRGVISFTGAPDNPVLDLSAERRISGSDVTAGVRVQGALATDLSLEIYSEPPMPQGEAMSYLIWGRGLDSRTGGDGAVLALSLAGGVVNRSSLVSAINRVPGIDNVSFGAEGTEEDAAATVSGFVGNRLYLSYGIGLYEPINVLTARFFLQTRLWLEVVSRLENSVDLYYSFDID